MAINWKYIKGMTNSCTSWIEFSSEEYYSESTNTTDYAPVIKYYNIDNYGSAKSLGKIITRDATGQSISQDFNIDGKLYCKNDLYCKGTIDIYQKDSNKIRFYNNNTQLMSIKNNSEYKRAARIVADHTRTAMVIIGDRRGVTPSNVDQGYVLRRLIRRAIRYAMKLEMPENSLSILADILINEYKDVYSEFEQNRNKILDELALEEKRFSRTLKQGEKELEKLVTKGVKKIDGETAFHLYDTYGYPLELTVEMAREKGIEVDEEGFKACFEKHQQLSKAGSSQRFECGLADHSEETTKLHTATHLLHAALRKVLGPQVAQKGSNITPERLRFDFSFERKMTPEEIAEVEKLVNEWINAKYEVVCEEMTVSEAKEQGAIGLFESKYGDRVKVYTMGPVSKEICGGPHAKNTGDLVNFKIKKEESSSAGVRRIKATINN